MIKACKSVSSNNDLAAIRVTLLVNMRSKCYPTDKANIPIAVHDTRFTDRCRWVGLSNRIIILVKKLVVYWIYCYIKTSQNCSVICISLVHSLHNHTVMYWAWRRWTFLNCLITNSYIVHPGFYIWRHSLIAHTWVFYLIFRHWCHSVLF